MFSKAKFVAISSVVVMGGVCAYFYGQSGPELVSAAPKQDPQIEESIAPVSDLEFSGPFQNSEPSPLPKRVDEANDHLADEEPWSVQQERHKKRIDELLELRQHVVVDSDEYYQIEDQINEEIEQMGLTEYHAGGWGIAMYPPNADSILEIAKDLDANQSQAYSQAIAALEDVRNQREKIDAERSANAENRVKDSAELTERHQRLVAREFKLVKDFPEFFKELDDLLARRHETLN